MALAGRMSALQLGQENLQVAVRCLFLWHGPSIKLMAHAVPGHYSGRYQKTFRDIFCGNGLPYQRAGSIG